MVVVCTQGGYIGIYVAVVAYQGGQAHEAGGACVRGAFPGEVVGADAAAGEV